MQKLKAENERLKSENRALTRVVSKLTAAATAATPKTSSSAAAKGTAQAANSHPPGSCEVLCLQSPRSEREERETNRILQRRHG